MASYYAIYQAVAFTSHSPLPLLLPARNPATCRRKPRFLANIDADRPKIQVNNQAKSQKPNYEVSPKRVVFSAGNMPPIKGVFPPGRLPLAVELDYVLNHPVTDGIISFLVILNCLAFALQTIDVGPVLHQVFINYEHGVSALFAIEYFGRWYGKGLSRRFLLTRSMIIDFIAVSPTGFAVTDQSEALFVRLLRLSRIFRLQRMVMDSESSKDMMESMTNIQIRLANIGLSLFNLLYVSAGLFYQAEKDVNPAIRNFFDAFYFSSITLFTVGFGDVTPLTSLGRISK